MRTQRLNRFKLWDSGIHFAIDPAQPHCRYLIWPGDLPKYTTPIHRSLGIQISAGYIDNSAVWLERCDAEWIIEERRELITSAFLFAAEEALLFLHENNRFHGAINGKHLGIRRDGWPVWLGVGLHEGSAKADIQDWEKLCISLIGKPLKKDRDPLTLKCPPDYLMNVENEVLYEITIDAKRDIRDAPDYTHTPSSSFPDETQTHLEFSEWTNSIPHADALSSPSSGAMGELLSWMLQNGSELTIDKKIPINLADILLPLDSLPAQNDAYLPLTLEWNDPDKEHTEILTVELIQTDSNLTYSISKSQQPLDNKPKQLLVIVLIVLSGLLIWIFYHFSPVLF